MITGGYVLSGDTILLDFISVFCGAPAVITVAFLRDDTLTEANYASLCVMGSASCAGVRLGVPLSPWGGLRRHSKCESQKPADRPREQQQVYVAPTRLLCNRCSTSYLAYALGCNELERCGCLGLIGAGCRCSSPQHCS